MKSLGEYVVSMLCGVGSTHTDGDQDRDTGRGSCTASTQHTQHLRTGTEPDPEATLYARYVRSLHGTLLYAIHLLEDLIFVFKYLILNP